MEPTSFGDPPLFGLYHPAVGNTARGRGVLLCPPVLHEHIRAHRAVRHLAVQLARDGYDVLRFDYFGVGDSAGSSAEARVARWHADVIAAADELRALSGAQGLAAVGIRLGATLAASALKLSIEQLVLWDPILDGRAYVERLERMHRTLLGDVTYFQHARRERPGIGLVGFPCPHELRADIAGLDLFGLARWSAPNLTVVSGATDEAERVLVDELRRRGLRTRLHPVATAVDWEELGSVGRSLTAAEATSATLAALAEG